MNILKIKYAPSLANIFYFMSRDNGIFGIFRGRTDVDAKTVLPVTDTLVWTSMNV